MMRRLLIALLVCALAGSAAAAVRIKDITALRGARDSQLIGYGLVIGLAGTGDSLRNSPFTQQALGAMLDRMGINVRGSSLANRNVAAVIVTADLPAGMDAGSRLDVTVSALGDSSSLMGGTLLLTQLSASDGIVYADAQGAVSVTGFDVAGQAQTLSQGVPTAGQIPNGAIIQQSVPPPPDELRMTLELRNPDYATAVRIVDAVNAYSQRRFRRRSAFEATNRTVELFRPPEISVTRYMAEIGDLPVEPDTVARVVIDSRTGTVVIGQDVQISTVAVTHGTLSVRVNEAPVASQPAPFSQGKTVEQPRTQIDAQQDGGQVAIVGGSSLRALVAGLNGIGVKPSGIIAILQAIKTAGALQADLVVQ
jgi:flagellar P-ring protein precursor FlgI